MANFHIIGTGIAGLAAATTLARAGQHVLLYEATSNAGGRCALLRDEHRNDGYDGCNALLFGGNRALRRYAEQIGSAHTLSLLDAGGKGYDSKRKQDVARKAFLLPPASPLIDLLQLMRMHLARKGTKADALFDYYHPLSETYIEPVCRGIMLCDASEASAPLMARRVWNLMRKGPEGLRMMLPRHSLYHSLVEPALRQVEQEGGSIYYNHSLKKIVTAHGHIQALHFAKQVKELKAHDRVILALPAHTLQQLAPAALPATLRQHDILNVHFHTYGESKSRIIPLTGACVDWVREQGGIITAVSYVPNHLLHLHDEAIARRIWADIRHAILREDEDMPSFRVVRSRRAHISTDDKRGLSQRYLDNGFLAGEIFGPESVVPLEAALLSGIRAAESALASL